MASPEYKSAFVLNARDKVRYVDKSVRGALAQTYPCHIIFSDQGSTDGTYEKMRSLVDEITPAANHKIEVVRCPIDGPYSMATQNRHIDWLIDQTDAEWIHQCSADDYSLPGRVAECMKAVAINNCAVVAVSQFFAKPGEEAARGRTPYGNVPAGYIPAGAGLTNLVFGTCLASYKKSFMKKIGPAPASVTMDVWCGYQAAMDDGYFVIPEPLHVHQEVEDVRNMGFQGKMRGATADKDWDALARLNELNHFQLFELYYECHKAQAKLYPLAHDRDKSAPISMMLGQGVAWYNRRKELHDKGLMPGVM